MSYKVELSLNCNNATWIDYSDYADVSKMVRYRQLDADKSPLRRTVSSVLFSGSAYVFIKTNLIDSANRASNNICAKITDLNFSGSPQYLFKFENRLLRWCDDDKCEFQADLIEVNPYNDCASFTTVADNHANEYQEFPTSGYPHPRFRYCDVIKPTFLFGALVTFFNLITLLLASFNIIVVTINAILGALTSVIGSNIPQIPLPSTLADSFLGCDRGWPSPFVRNYMSNVCSKCGITIDATKSPIFHDSGSIYYNTAVLSAYTTKGVKMSTAKGFIPANQPSWTLTAFFKTLVPVFNSRWYISEQGEAYFDRKDRIGETIWGTTPAIDLSGSDADYMLSSVCYSWNGKGKPYRIYNKYGLDATDAIGNELIKRFNGEYLDSSSPNYTDTIEFTSTDYGAASFVLDGKDSPWDINLVKSVANQLLVWHGNGDDWKHCLKSMTDTLQLAKLIIYDPASDLEDARAIKAPYVDYLTIPALDDDDPSDISGTIINPADCYYYNHPMSHDPDASTINDNLWSEFHSIDAPDPAKKDVIQFEVILDYCNETYNTLDIFQTVVMPNGTDEGEIESVEFDHGRRQIKLTGNLKN
jgi:hypothetical protein